MFRLENDAKASRASPPKTPGTSPTATPPLDSSSPKLPAPTPETPSRLFQDLQVPPKQRPPPQSATRSASRSRPLGLDQNEQPPEATSRMRKFYLARDSLAGTGQSPTLSGGISKSRRQNRDRIACFVENRGNLLNYATREQTDGLQRDKSLEGDQLSTEKVRRRPNATAAERAWRDQAWPRAKVCVADNESAQNHPDKAHPTGSEKELLSLAQELQRFAMAETKQIQIQTAKHASSHPPLKFQPKPPKTRPNHSTRAKNSANSDDEFVVDTYVRSALASFPPQGATNLVQHLETGNFGILVVEDGEDAAFWESAADQVETDSVNLSDEDDENGKIFCPNHFRCGT